MERLILSCPLDIFERLHQQMCEACEQMHEMARNVYIPKETKELIDQLPALVKRYYIEIFWI